LIEVLVVLAIISLIGGGVGVAVYRHYKGAQGKAATSGARTIRGAVRSWWVTSGSSGCPTVARLVSDGVLDEDSPLTDPWGTPWRIECSGDSVSVGSDGPDKAPSTDDDIRVPPLKRGADNAASDGV
jgi:type II secretory pathway pseudopilin PulG